MIIRDDHLHSIGRNTVVPQRVIVQVRLRRRVVTQINHVTRRERSVLLRLLHARRVHVRRIDQLQLISQSELFEVSDRDAHSRGHAFHRHREESRTRGERRPVDVLRRLRRPALVQHVRQRLDVRQRLRAHHLERLGVGDIEPFATVHERARASRVEIPRGQARGGGKEICPARRRRRRAGLVIHRRGARGADEGEEGEQTYARHRASGRRRAVVWRNVAMGGRQVDVSFAKKTLKV